MKVNHRREKMGRKRKDGTPSSSPWKQRRVAFMVSDPWHKISPISIIMPVRVKERTGEKTIFEGPIEAMWEVVQQRLGVTKRLGTTDFDVSYDLVGVLFANDEADLFGRIDWLVQSEAKSVEEGQDRIKQSALEVETGG
jgi:hypothetical protein